MNYRAILFDKDGTLIESEGAWVPFYRQQLMRLKGVSEADADQLMSLTGYEIATGRMKGGSIIAGGTTRQLVAHWWPGASETERHNIMTAMDQAAHGDVKMDLSPITDLKNLLQSFRTRGWHTGIATNDSIVSTRRQIADLGIAELFDAVIASDTVEVPKPSGDMVRKFSLMTGVALQEIIMVGDNFHDIEEARRGGAGLAVAVLSGNGTEADLAHIADVTLPSIAHLPEYLGHR